MQSSPNLRKLNKNMNNGFGSKKNNWQNESDYSFIALVAMKVGEYLFTNVASSSHQSS